MMVRKLLEKIANKVDELSVEEPSKGNEAKLCGLSFLEGAIDGCFIVGAVMFLAGVLNIKPKEK